MRQKPVHVARDFVKVPRELLKLHRDVTLLADIFFVNQFPFFLTLRQNICFTAVNHLKDWKAKSIFEAFDEMYQFYLNRGFRIMAVHVDGEFTPLQSMIQGMPGGPMVKMASSNEHVPEID